MDLQVGDFVVCTDTASDGVAAQVFPGRIYVVEEIMPGESGPHPCKSGVNCSAPGIRLRRPKTSPAHLWWCSTYFTRVYRPPAIRAEELFYVAARDEVVVRRELEQEARQDAEKFKNNPPKGTTNYDGSCYFNSLENLGFTVNGWSNDEHFWRLLFLSLLHNQFPPGYDNDADGSC